MFPVKDIAQYITREKYNMRQQNCGDGTKSLKRGFFN
jgi:hypothetical protein